MDWDGSTKYDWGGAVNVWNSHRAIIRPDAWNTYEDVIVSDYNDLGSYFIAITMPNSLATSGRQNGEIRFNIAHMDDAPVETQKSLVIMQLGYALGLMDNNEDAKSVMNLDFDNLTLSDDDISALNYLYDHVY